MLIHQERKLFLGFKSTILLFFLSVSTSFGQSKWECTNPFPQGNDLNSVTYGNGLFVAVGAGGTILTSLDDSTWTNNNSETIHGLNSVTYGNGLFVVVGDSGTILTSVDGKTWTIKNSGIKFNLNSITYGNSEFMAVGDTGSIISSSNGSIWTTISSGITHSLSSVAYGNGKFVAVGTYLDFTHDSGTIMTSSDGMTWTTEAPNNHICSVTYGNGQFLAVSNTATILISSDGLTWTTKNTNIDIYILFAIYVNGQFVAGQMDGTILTSLDGLTWTVSNSNTQNGITSVTYGNDQFIAVGVKGTILASSDGTTWTTKRSGTTNEFTSVTYGNGKFVAVGYYDSVLTSPDGKTWTKIYLPPRQTLQSIAYGDSLSGSSKSLFVAVGDTGGTYLTSPDGTAWTTKTTTQNFSCVTYGNGLFMAKDGNNFSISTDGIAWTTKNPSYNNLRILFVTYCDNQFVALDNSVGQMKNPDDWPQPDTNKILTSLDGTSWTLQNIYPNNLYSVRPSALNCITYGNSASSGQAGQFVALGYYDTILTSPDGIVWTARYSGATNYLESVIFGNGQFVAVGKGGTILTSLDGTTWTQQNSGTINSLFSVTYANDVFMAVGDNGTILISKADPVGVAFQTKAKPNISGFKIHVSNNDISAILPDASLRSQLKVGLFNVSGKRIYSATAGTQNGILNIPTKGFPAGKYFMSITDENKRTLNSGFVLTR